MELELIKSLESQFKGVKVDQEPGKGEKLNWFEGAVQFSSVAQSYLILCDLVDCSTPGLPVHHELLEFTQTHVQWISDAIQPSHPLSSPSPPSFNLSQHQSLFKWVSSSPSGGQSIGVSASASVLPVNTQDWSPLGWVRVALWVDKATPLRGWVPAIS